MSETAEPLIPLPPDELPHSTRVIKVRVVVFEDGVEMDAKEIGYYRGQDYEVQVVTPDGVDLTVFAGRAGWES